MALLAALNRFLPFLETVFNGFEVLHRIEAGFVEVVQETLMREVSKGCRVISKVGLYLGPLLLIWQSI